MDGADGNANRSTWVGRRRRAAGLALALILTLAQPGFGPALARQDDPPTDTAEVPQEPDPTEAPTSPPEQPAALPEPTETPQAAPGDPTMDASPADPAPPLVSVADVTPISVVVGSMDPENPGTVGFGLVDAGKVVVKHSAVTVLVDGGGGWTGGDCTIVPGAGNPASDSPPLLEWRLAVAPEEEPNPWTAFAGPGGSLDGSCIPADEDGAADAYVYDLRLTNGWTTTPGDYTWTVTFTVTGGP